MLPWRRAGSVSRRVGGSGGDDNKYGGEEQDGRDGSVPAAGAWAGGEGKRGRDRPPPHPFLQGVRAAAGSRGEERGCLARSPALRGAGGERLLAEGEKGSGAGAPCPGSWGRRGKAPCLEVRGTFQGVNGSGG